MCLNERFSACMQTASPWKTGLHLHCKVKVSANGKDTYTEMGGAEGIQQCRERIWDYNGLDGLAALRRRWFRRTSCCLVKRMHIYEVKRMAMNNKT